MDVFKRLLKLAKPHAVKFSIAMICMLAVGATTSALAFLVKPALDEIFLKRNAEMLKWIPLAVVGIYLMKGACNYAQTVLMNFIGQRVVADLRESLYRKIQTQSLAFFTKNPTGTLMSRITNDVGFIQGAVSEAVSVPVIASGGAGNLAHLYQALITGKADAVLAASIFHYRIYSIRQAKDYLAERGIPVRR